MNELCELRGYLWSFFSDSDIEELPVGSSFIRLESGFVTISSSFFKKINQINPNDYDALNKLHAISIFTASITMTTIASI